MICLFVAVFSLSLINKSDMSHFIALVSIIQIQLTNTVFMSNMHGAFVSNTTSM